MAIGHPAGTASDRALQAQLAHQGLHGAACDPDAFPVKLLQAFLDPVHGKIGVPDPADLYLNRHLAPIMLTLRIQDQANHPLGPRKITSHAQTAATRRPTCGTPRRATTNPKVDHGVDLTIL